MALRYGHMESERKADRAVRREHSAGAETVSEGALKASHSVYIKKRLSFVGAPRIKRRSGCKRATCERACARNERAIEAATSKN